MATITVDKDDIVSIVSNAVKGSGAFGYFVRVAPGIGLKFFQQKLTTDKPKRVDATLSYDDAEDRRDKSYDAQQLAHNHGIAPSVGEKIQFESKGHKYFGYFTETIERTYGMYGDDGGMYYDSYTDKWWMNTNEPAYHDFKELYNKMMDIGLCRLASDLHSKNWGYLNGRAVCIDFYIE